MRHYQPRLGGSELWLVAKTIASAPGLTAEQREVLAVHFADRLERTNPAFDRGLFMQAARGEVQ